MLPWLLSERLIIDVGVQDNHVLYDLFEVKCVLIEDLELSYGLGVIVELLAVII